MPSIEPIKQFLLSPASFFEERPPAETLPIAAGVVVVFAVCLTIGIVLVGHMLAGTVDATVTMDNPDRPPDTICEGLADDQDSLIAERCDEPRTIERDAGAIVQEAVNDLAWMGIVGPLFLWGVGGIVIWGVGRLAGGTPSGTGAMALAGWAALPEFFRLAVGLLAIHVALADVTITDPERGVAVVESAMASIEPVLIGASVVTFVWQWSLLSGGLANDADISWKSAVVAVGAPLGIFFLVSILS